MLVCQVPRGREGGSWGWCVSNQKYLNLIWVSKIMSKLDEYSNCTNRLILYQQKSMLINIDVEVNTGWSTLIYILFYVINCYD